MTRTVTVHRAVVAGHREPVDVELRDGVVHAVGPAGAGCGPTDVDAEGRLVLPGLVDAHVHLDKAYVLTELEDRGWAGGGSLQDAMAATRELRASTGLDGVRARASRLLSTMAATGTVAARAHVEVGDHVDPELTRLHHELAAEHPAVDLQLVAFPQHGTSHSPEARRRLERALDEGCEVVGGCPYADDDPAAHLDLVCALARDRGLPLDLHADLDDDAGSSQLDLVLDRVESHGLNGRVALGHVTTLSGFSPSRFVEIATRLRDTGTTVVVLPTTDLWLSGRTTARPGVRGLAPLRDLWACGVEVAIASNNHQNPFTPVSGGGLLREAWLASLVGHVGDRPGQERLLRAVTEVPARLLGRGAWEVAPGSSAPLLVLDCASAVDAVREAPAVLTRLD